MKAKLFGGLLAAAAIFAVVVSLLAEKNEFIILNLAIVAFAAGVFINFLNQ